MLVLVLSSVAAAQPGVTVSSTTVSTLPAGGTFYVDGQLYTNSFTFLWPQGSKHTLSITTAQQVPGAKTQYTFTGWTDSTGTPFVSTPTVVITADPSITWYQAVLTLQYAVSLNFFSCSAGVCSGPGTVFVNGTAYSTNTDIYFNAGSTITLRAEPAPGYVFTGWLQGIGNSSQGFLNSFTLNGPTIIYPQFLPAAAITFATNVPGLEVLPDRTLMYTPVTLQWGVGTTHTVGAPPSQTDLQGRLWAFSSWSDGGAMMHNYTPANQLPVVLTATYLPGGRVSVFTSPAGLNLIVDGVTIGPPYNLVWAAGVPHTIAAAAQQVDITGKGWAFQSWSNGGPASQTLTLTAAQIAAGFRLTANYAPSSLTMAQVAVQSSPPGVTVLVDGANCVTPCTVQRTIGSQVYMSAPASVQVSGNTRLVFTNWADGASPSRSIMVQAGVQTFTADYQSYYLLSYTSNPTGAVTWQFSPASPDGFYLAQTVVAVSINVASGFSFEQWEGDASGTARAVTVTLNQPRSIEAVLKRTGDDGIDSISNAAGPTPEDAVAPGSVISIYGPALAPSTATGPASPLALTLAGVSINLSGRLVPLLFVSPGQINAVLPSGFAAGVHTLTVQVPGQPDAIGVFTMQRNAPGLFSQQISGQAYVVAMHEDGSPVTPQSPARRNELVTALGTGFGPYQPQPPDGFAVPASPAFPLADQAELIYQGQTILPVFAGAAVNRVGVTAIQFRIADPLPTASTVAIMAQVNGQDSNTVLLPLE
jgi:uncharacterized protein (TIGR03437 family)